MTSDASNAAGGQPPDEAQPFAPPPADPSGEYGVNPPEDVQQASRVNLGYAGRAGLPYEPFSDAPPPPDPTERQFSLVQILGLMLAAALTLGLFRKFLAEGEPSVVAAVTGFVFLVAFGVQVVFQPTWLVFRMTVWLLLGTYLVMIGVTLLS